MFNLDCSILLFFLIHGEFPIHYACENKKIQIVKLLIDKGANINTQSKDTKSSPLSSATAYGLTSIIKLLLSKGAKKNTKDSDKMTPLDIAKWKGFHSIVKILQY